MRLAMMMMIGVLAGSARADLGDQLFKLLADDGAAFDFFGYSVAISPDSIGISIVGARLDGDFSGSVYLFDTSTGRQIDKLVADDVAAGDNFGFSVAISPDSIGTAIVGAIGDDDNGNQSGSAYLFDITTGRQLFKLLPEDGAAEDLFGFSVAISRDSIGTAIVGAWQDDDNGSYSGSAYLFDTTTGRQLFKLLPEDGAEFDHFGISVAISGTTAIVGAHYPNDLNGDHSGSAYLFDTTTGRQIAKLLPSDGAAEGDGFGRSVAIGGATAIVGTFLGDGNGYSSGSAYLFDVTTGDQIAKLLPSDGAAGDHFGSSVAISPDSIGAVIVGAPRHDDNGPRSGSAYLFDTTTGRQIAKLLPNDGAAGDFFGYSVAINGTPGNETAIVGAYFDDDNGNASGSAYLFDAAGAPGNCPWDIDANGSVGASDLLALLASWGPCKGCPTDFDGNGNVGASDLLALLANWGPCP